MTSTTYTKYIFYIKLQLFVTASMTRILIWIRIGLAPWIRKEVKSLIWIRIETNADPQHWKNFRYLCRDPWERLPRSWSSWGRVSWCACPPSPRCSPRGRTLPQSPTTALTTQQASVPDPYQFGKPDPDSRQSENPDPRHRKPDLHPLKSRIWSAFKWKAGIGSATRRRTAFDPHQRERTALDPHQRESRIWIRIEVKGRIWIRIKVKGRIWIRIKVKSQDLWRNNLADPHKRGNRIKGDLYPNPHRLTFSLLIRNFCQDHILLRILKNK